MAIIGGNGAFSIVLAWSKGICGTDISATDLVPTSEQQTLVSLVGFDYVTATFDFGSHKEFPFLAEAGEEKNVRCHMIVENARFENYLRYPLRVQNS